MKSIFKIYEMVLLENIKDESIKKFGEGSKEYVEKFLNEIRHKETDPKKKDINYWVKEGLDIFKDYVDNFKSTREIKKSNYFRTEVDNGNGKLIKTIDGYELWKVDSYKAAKELGRNYKNEPTKWCISSDQLTHWKTYYKEQDNRIYFLIREEMSILPKENRWNKIAIVVTDTDDINYWEIWDKYDNECIEQNALKWFNLPKELKDLAFKIKNIVSWYEVSHQFNIEEFVSKGSTITEEKDGVYNVEGDVYIQDVDFEKLPVKFNIVTGNFEITGNKKLETLEGCPREIGNDFRISSCPKLKSLKYSPIIIRHVFYFNNNPSIIDLEGMCQNIDGTILIQHCKNLKSLKGCIQSVKFDFNIANNSSLLSLQYGPKEVGMMYDASNCFNLQSLDGSPKEIYDSFSIHHCSSLKSLKGGPEYIVDYLDIDDCHNLEEIGQPIDIKGSLHANNIVSLDLKEIKKYITVGKKIYSNTISKEDPTLGIDPDTLKI